MASRTVPRAALEGMITSSFPCPARMAPGLGGQAGIRAALHPQGLHRHGTTAPHQTSGRLLLHPPETLRLAQLSRSGAVGLVEHPAPVCLSRTSLQFLSLTMELPGAPGPLDRWQRVIGCDTPERGTAAAGCASRGARTGGNGLCCSRRGCLPLGSRMLCRSAPAHPGLQPRRGRPGQVSRHVPSCWELGKPCLAPGVAQVVLALTA